MSQKHSQVRKMAPEMGKKLVRNTQFFFHKLKAVVIYTCRQGTPHLSGTNSLMFLPFRYKLFDVLRSPQILVPV